MLETRRLTLPVLGVLAAGLVAGCSGPSFDFRTDDPSGYVACRDITASQLTDDDDERERFLETAAASAAASQTGDIRATVDPPVDPNRQEFIGQEDIGQYTVDEDALFQACEDAGFQRDDIQLVKPS
ncbi:hypothetical protein [Cellulomonas aerilata]|nr:hypothetical protein [Cellulomonas aerilata]